jgi:hypothetical protein
VGLSTSDLAAAILVGGGLASITVGVLLRAQRRSESLAELLELVGGEHDVPVAAVTESPASVRWRKCWLGPTSRSGQGSTCSWPVSLRS